MNILIVKTGALGDVVRCSFLAQALKEKFKRLSPKIFWLTQKNATPIFINNPYVDELTILENKNSLKKIQFDIIINLEEEKQLVDFISNLNFKEIVGFVSKNGKILPTPTCKEWFNMSALGESPKNDILKKQNKKTHRQIISEIIQTPPEKYEPFLRLTQQQRKIADTFLRRHYLSRHELIIGINTGSADRWPKALPIKKTAQLINQLQEKFNAKILLFGGPQERQRNFEIQKLTKCPLIDTGCGNNLLEFPALISVCNLFITTDSLGLHIALALKRKTICLIGPTSHSELDMYGIGEKIIAKSKCVCCYKSDCKSMEKIQVNEILKQVKKLLQQKITLLITAFKEPNIHKAVEAALNQKTKYNYEVLVSVPDKPTKDIVKKYMKKNKNLKLLDDPGKGKSFALNLAFKNIRTDILILTDGDIFISDNSIEEITNLFNDPEIGVVSGKPTPQENKNTKFGYWAHFLFDAVHEIRKSSFINHEFIECSGYLFAFRKQKINQIPLDVAEDTVIPYYFWQMGYKIGYAEKAEVYVKNANNLKDWIVQKTRTHKSHGKLHKYVDTITTPRVKTFATELRGATLFLQYPKNIQEILWTSQLFLARLYTWGKYFIDTRFKNKLYQDAWERSESTKT